ncbi:MAG: hypothetical protein WDM84_07205 [Bauldia sp.]
MSDLIKALKFTVIPKDSTDRNPVFQRRLKLIERLDDQRKLLDDPAHTRTIQRWTKQDGQRVMTEKRLKVQPWWRTDDKGAVVFFVRHGWKPVEFEKGKAGIAVASQDKLKAVIDTLISATKQGELDAILAQASGSTTVGKQKRAA